MTQYRHSEIIPYMEMDFSEKPVLKRSFLDEHVSVSGEDERVRVDSEQEKELFGEGLLMHPVTKPKHSKKSELPSNKQCCFIF
jgi:hypothetical protein